MRQSRRLIVTGIVISGLGLGSQVVHAAPKLRAQISQKGDFVLIGNTLAHECAPGTPAPTVGTVGACGLNTGDTAPDVYWRADSPIDGQAEANLAITPAQARSTAVLALPPGASVTHAYLYWAATLTAPGTDTSVTLDRIGGLNEVVDSIQCSQSTNNSYQCVSDVTAQVQGAGPGGFRVSDVNTQPLANVNVDTVFAAWWMAVFYTDPAGTLRNLALFDGLDPVANGMPQNTMLTGFLVPNMGFTAKLGIIAFEGDNAITGDQFFFNGGMPLNNGQNPANNFFNSTRSNLGMTVSVAGDLPRLTGAPQSMSGIDMDVVDVTAKVMAGQTSAAIQGTSTQDLYYLAGFVTSISDYRPNFTTSTKTVKDVNGGVAIAGDVLEYELTAINSGNDNAIGVVLTDPIPAGVTYVPESLVITAGPNMGAKTDAAADDQGDFAANTVTVRLGVGADAVQGGSMAIGTSSTITFQVTIDDDALGIVENQGVIKAGGENGAPPVDTVTDGNGGMPGSPETEILIEECGDDTMCPDSKPICATDLEPNICVQCIEDADCGGLVPVCEVQTNTCVCVPAGAEVCDGLDNDCNDALDEGFGVGDACSAGIGECASQGSVVCDGLDSSACDAVPGTPVDELCDGLDNNCNGNTDEGFDLGGACTSGLGECAVMGVAVCDGQGGVGCDGVPVPAGEEICGDQLDSDCDGNNDNGCACTTDPDCGAPDSGQVCEGMLCIDGCRGTGGNGCPAGLVCTSDDQTVGECVPDSGTGSDSNSGATESDTASDTASSSPTTGASASASASAGDTEPTESNSDTATDSDTSNNSGAIDDEGFGCDCDSDGAPAPIGLTLLVLASLGLGRRRRQA